DLGEAPLALGRELVARAERDRHRQRQHVASLRLRSLQALDLRERVVDLLLGGDARLTLALRALPLHLDALFLAIELLAGHLCLALAETLELRERGTLLLERLDGLGLA